MVAAVPSVVGAQSNAPLPAVTVTPASEASVDASETFTGRVEPINGVEVRARISGFVQEIGFVEGGQITEGDMLFRIEPDAYEAAVMEVRGRLAAAEAEKTLADIEVDRQATLLERETVAEAVLQRAQAEQGKIIGQIDELKGSLRAAELNLSYTQVLAPFTGRVGFTEIDIGAFVGPESGTLLHLSSIDPIYVSFPVSEAALLDFRARRAANPEHGALAVELTLANGAAYEPKGTVELVDTRVQAGTDTVLVRATFPNPDGLLLDGQLVTVRLVEEATELSIVVPATALQRDQAGYFVFVVGEGNTAERRPITPGETAGMSIVVSEGLEVGEQVVVEGMQRVRPGAEVDPSPADAAVAAPAQ